MARIQIAMRAGAGPEPILAQPRQQGLLIALDGQEIVRVEVENQLGGGAGGMQDIGHQTAPGYAGAEAPHQGAERLRFGILLDAREPERAVDRAGVDPDGRELLLRSLGGLGAVLLQVRIVGTEQGLAVQRQRFGRFAGRTLRGPPGAAFGFEPEGTDALQHTPDGVVGGVRWVPA